MTDLLVVEDDDQLRKALVLTLRSRGYTVHAAATGAEALERVRTSRLDVVVLDLGLPDIDGVRVIEQVREHSGVPIVVLSARRDQSDKVSALDAGADDYLTKPFGIEELLARLRAAARRSGAPVDAGVVRTPDFVVDLGRKKVVATSGEEIHLTPTEWGVLEVLVRAGRPARDRGRPAPGGLGAAVRDPDELPAGLPRAAAAEARARPGPPPVPHHRARSRLPFRRGRDRWLRRLDRGAPRLTRSETHPKQSGHRREIPST